MELSQTVINQIEHVPRGIVSEGHIIFQLFIFENMAVDPFRSEKGRSCVIIPAQDPDLQEFIPGQDITNGFLLRQKIVV